MARALLGTTVKRAISRAVGPTRIALAPKSLVGAAARPSRLQFSSDATREATGPKEEAVGPSETLEFQAEVRQLLDIVAHSLYTDTEVFIRELISNSADALEKARHASLVSGEQLEELNINVNMDKDAKTITIQDNGIGLTAEQLKEQLGTIAHSGSKNFLEALKAKGEKHDDLIGKFGVGFYSSFMVADKVEVFTRPRGEDTGHLWVSAGDGTYTVSEASNVAIGTKVVCHLKEGFYQFADVSTVRNVITKHSNFINFPISIDGEVANKIQALWTQSPSQVTDEQYTEFYRFTSKMFDTPCFRLHYSADVPISIRALLFVPSTHMENALGVHTEPGVSIYSRRVLIKPNAEGFLPSWLRFVKGVVDSEDLPLSISREQMQNSALMRTLGVAITRRLVKFLGEEARKDVDKYDIWWKDFGQFVREGIFQRDETYPGQLKETSKLFRITTTVTGEDKACFFQDIVDRLEAKDKAEDKEDKEGVDEADGGAKKQKQLYYVQGENYADALNSPYYEAFRNSGIEVMVVTNHVDDLLFTHMSPELVPGYELVNVERADAPEAAAEGEAKVGLSEADANELASWLSGKLSEFVNKVEVTKRLDSTPAVIFGHDRAFIQNMSMLQGLDMPALKYTLLINPEHPIIRGLHETKGTNPSLAVLVAQQLYYNAYLSAGLRKNATQQIPNINSILEHALGVAEDSPEDSEQSKTD